MPASARLPSGTRVEVLCGQPEQKYGVRANGIDLAAGLPLARVEPGDPLGEPRLGGRRPRAARAMTRAIWLGDNSPFDGKIHSPALVELADEARAPVGRPVVELLLQLRLDDGALLLDDQHLLQPLGEAPHSLGLERPRHRHLVEPQAQRPRLRLADAEFLQRLAHIEIGFAGGDDAEPRLRRVDDDAVEPVGAGEGERRRHLEAVQPRFLVERRVGPADVEPARRHLEILRQDDLDPPPDRHSIEAELSIVSATVLNATQQPE